MNEPNPYATPNCSNWLIRGEHFVARLNFWSVYSIAIFATALVATPILWVASFWDLVEWKIIAPALGIAFVLQAIIICWQSVILSPDFLRCADFWGRHHTIHVASIKQVEEVGLPPFRFLKLVHDEEFPPLWLPLFMRKPSNFWNYVHRELPLAHPLREWSEHRHGFLPGNS